jgi:hypothetical protein
MDRTQYEAIVSAFVIAINDNFPAPQASNGAFTWQESEHLKMMVLEAANRVVCPF